MLPVRCVTCNNLIGHLWQQYTLESKHGNEKQTLDKLGLIRICCRRMLLTHVRILPDTLVYGKQDDVLDDCGTQLLREVHTEQTFECV